MHRMAPRTSQDRELMPTRREERREHRRSILTACQLTCLIAVSSFSTGCRTTAGAQRSTDVVIHLVSDSPNVALMRGSQSTPESNTPGSNPPAEDARVCTAPCGDKVHLEPGQYLYLAGDGVSRSREIPNFASDSELVVHVSRAGSSAAKTASTLGSVMFFIGVPVTLAGLFAMGMHNATCIESPQSPKCQDDYRTFTGVSAAITAIGLGLLLGFRTAGETEYTIESR